MPPMARASTLCGVWVPSFVVVTVKYELLDRVFPLISTMIPVVALSLTRTVWLVGNKDVVWLVT